MEIRILKQPDEQLGKFIEECVNKSKKCKKIIFISAFVALRTILRLRENVLAQKENGADISFNIGFDLYGTSKNVLEELIRWDCNTFLTHNALSRVTFHPKVYCIETDNSAQVIVGSNNLTEGGMYSNYEISSIATFQLPEDETEYQNYISKIHNLINPKDNGTTKELSNELIQQLLIAGLIRSEKEARKYSEKQKNYGPGRKKDIKNPFDAKPIAFPPLLPKRIRPNVSSNNYEESEDYSFLTDEQIPDGVIVWRKVLTASDASQVSGNTNPVGGVRLTQADFKVNGIHINQTQYFRQLFDDYDWEQKGRHYDQEHTFVPMRVRIESKDYGIIRFEISHKPSGEAGQGNYTTMLHWGSSFSKTVRGKNLKSWVFSIYETPDSEYDFFLDFQR